MASIASVKPLVKKENIRNLRHVESAQNVTRPPGGSNSLPTLDRAEQCLLRVVDPTVFGC